MTIGISGPVRRDPWRDFVRTLFRGAIVLVICLVVLGLTSGLLVDWLWFAKLGYASVFQTTIAAQILTFLIVFALTATGLWLNARFALRAAQRNQFLTAPVQPSILAVTPLAQLRQARDRLPWRMIIAIGAGLVAIAVAWFELSNWMIFLTMIYGAPYGTADPLYGNDIGFYLFSLPALVEIMHWFLLCWSSASFRDSSISSTARSSLSPACLPGARERAGVRGANAGASSWAAWRAGRISRSENVHCCDSLCEQAAPPGNSRHSRGSEGQTLAPQAGMTSDSADGADGADGAGAGAGATRRFREGSQIASRDKDAAST